METYTDTCKYENVSSDNEQDSDDVNIILVSSYMTPESNVGVSTYSVS